MSDEPVSSELEQPVTPTSELSVGSDAGFTRSASQDGITAQDSDGAHIRVIASASVCNGACKISPQHRVMGCSALCVAPAR